MPTFITSGRPDIIIRGSHGDLTVDRTTGMVTHYAPDEESAEYSDIVRFDVATLPADPECDILGVGFWDDKGTYTAPLRWSATEQMWVES